MLDLVFLIEMYSSFYNCNLHNKMQTMTKAIVIKGHAPLAPMHASQLTGEMIEKLKYSTFEMIVNFCPGRAIAVVTDLCVGNELQLSVLTLEPAIRAMPTHSFRFMPPDRSLAAVSRLSSKCNTLIMLSTSCLTLEHGQPFSCMQKHLK